METENKVITGILLTILTFTLIGDLSLEPTHYCINKEFKAYCYDLSDSKVTCYTQPEKTGGKQCRGGQWEVIPVEEKDAPQIENIKYNSPSGGYHHTKDGCTDC